jgi:hypothetical protein
MQDADPLDDLTNGEELGIVLRTDYADESAWEMFLSKLRDGEEEIKAFFTNGEENSDACADKMNHSDSEESADSDTSPLIKIINAASPELRVSFNNISNLTALRLLNDVDIQLCPTPQAGVKRINPSHRLIDQWGRQEIYTGHTLWIYDAQSNIDQCVRLVSGQSDIYGTVTYVFNYVRVVETCDHMHRGDSWRARVTHIYELQLNMSHLGMKIDFGGLDRWDFNERKRNLEEAASL